MSKQRFQRPDYYAGSNWLRWSVFVVAITVFSVWLLTALRQMQTMGEKTMVELTVRNISTGLKVAMSEAVIEQRGGEIAAWVGTNPVRWLVAPPLGYIGECRRGDEYAVGAWCFESVSGDLVYRPRNPTGLKLKVGRGDEPKVLRWRIVMSGNGDKDAVAWMTIRNIAPYEWLIE